jgi:uncharacterized damage-inducible protein DinB
MNGTTRFGLTFLAALAMAAAALAQAPPSTPTFTSDWINDVDGVGKKLVDLAEKMPVDKYGWRPAEGVRSVSEVYMHVAAANYLLTGFLGAKAPEGVNRGLETSVTDKAKIIEWLKKSLEHVKAVAAGIKEADLDKMVTAFGHQMSQRRVLMIVQTHMHEHLGQSIAYARMNGVTPPWSDSGGKPAPAKKS